MVATSKTILPYEPGYVGTKKRKNGIRKPRSGCGSATKLARSLIADKIRVSGPVDEPEVKSRDELRKLLRVVASPDSLGRSLRAVSVAGMSERIANAGHQCEH